MTENELSAETQKAESGPYLLKPNGRAMFKLAFGSAGTISTLMCAPDAVGILPCVPDAFHWAMRMLGLWLSAFTLWSLSFLALLHFARFAGGGILVTAGGLRLWRFGRLIPWSSIKALVVEAQPFFSFAFRLKPVARRLTIYEERAQPSIKRLLGRKAQESGPGLVPHSVPAFQFSFEEFTSLFARACDASLGFVPNSVDCFAFVPEAAGFLRAANKRAVVLRIILSAVIALGLIVFLGRRAATDYFYNCGSSYFRHEEYARAADSYRMAAKVDPTFAAAWDQLARSELRSGHAVDAEKHWLQALRMKPDLVESKLGLCNIYITRGELDRAKRLLDHCVQLAPHNKSVYLLNAELCIKRGDPNQAQKLAESVERVSGNDPDALAAVARVFLNLKQYGRASELARKAVQMNPRCSGAVRVLGQLETAR